MNRNAKSPSSRTMRERSECWRRYTLDDSRPPEEAGRGERGGLGQTSLSRRPTERDLSREGPRIRALLAGVCSPSSTVRSSSPSRAAWPSWRAVLCRRRKRARSSRARRRPFLSTSTLRALRSFSDRRTTGTTGPDRPSCESEDALLRDAMRAPLYGFCWRSASPRSKYR